MSFALPVIAAHRGASHEAPENTLAAIELGWREQADAAEIDVHLTADGQVVAIHDADLLRTAGLQAAVAQTPLAAIQSLDAGRWKSPAWAGQRIPTLGQILDQMPTDKQLVIEIKSTAKAMNEALASAVRQGPVPLERLIFIDFKPDRLRNLLDLLPQAHCLLLASGPPAPQEPDAEPDAGRRELDRLIAQARENGFQGLNLSWKWAWDEAMVRQIRLAGLSSWVWTVNDPAMALHLARCGVMGITTDWPGMIRSHLQGRGSQAGGG